MCILKIEIQNYKFDIKKFNISRAKTVQTTNNRKNLFPFEQLIEHMGDKKVHDADIENKTLNSEKIKYPQKDQFSRKFKYKR